MFKNDNEGKAQRKESRHYLPRERSFSVLFFVRGKSYSGLLKDFSPSGLGIILDEDILARQGDKISRMFIGKPDNEYMIEDLEIAQIRIDYTTEEIHLGILVRSDETRTRMEAIWHLLVEGAPQPKKTKEYNFKRIPSFVRKQHYSDEAIETRLNWARKVSGSNLNHLDKSILNPSSLAGNIENYIGAVQVPVGLAGPILINGTYTQGYIPVPLATTEGALVSSMTRGAYSFNLCGGIDVYVNRQVMLRAPVFFCKNLHGAVNLKKWVMTNFDRIKAKAESVSSVANLTEIAPLVYGRQLHLRFYYNTGDASGQNMTTACTYYACEWITSQIKEDDSIKYIHYQIDGNMSGDKKMNVQNFIKGRGTSVVAEGFISEKVLERFLHLTPRELVRAWDAGAVGGAEIGMIGSDVNVSNIVAAIFTATGQDIACTYESSGGIFNVAEEEGGVVVTLHVPALIIGTLGGGTHIPTQRECLEIMKCYGPHKLFRFAEIIGAACLSLGVSTLSAIYTNEFASAHEKLGRNRPTKRLSKSELNEHFFTDSLLDKTKSVVSIKESSLDSSAGIISSILEEKKSIFTGIFNYKLTTEDEKKNQENISSVLKIKADDTELINMGVGLARLSGEDRLPGLFETNIDVFGYTNSHIRELEIYRLANDELRKFFPKIYGIKRDDDREIFAILMEDVSKLSHFDTYQEPEKYWDDEHLKIVLKDLAKLHSIHCQDYTELPKEMMVHQLEIPFIEKALDCISELLKYNRKRFPDMITDEVYAEYERFLKKLPMFVTRMTLYPMTLTHNDFHPRNICLREENGEKHLVVYDWELAAVQNPQHDLIEFLIYALPINAPMEQFRKYFDYYFEHLKEYIGKNLIKEEFMDVLYLNALELGLIRYNIYLLTHNIMKYDFMDRVYLNLRNLILEYQESRNKRGIE